MVFNEYGKCSSILITLVKGIRSPSNSMRNINCRVPSICHRFLSTILNVTVNKATRQFVKSYNNIFSSKFFILRL